MYKLITSVFISLAFIFCQGQKPQFSEDNISGAVAKKTDCSKDSLAFEYTYAIVKDSVFMDKIIAAINDAWSDSIYNLIIGEYGDDWFFKWDRSRKWRFCEIDIFEKCYTEPEKINERFITEELNKEVMNDSLTTMRITYSYASPPFSKYCAKYKGNTYYFGNDDIITPINQIKIERVSSDLGIEGYLGYVFLYFVYYNGRFYIHPDRDLWFTG